MYAAVDMILSVPKESLFLGRAWATLSQNKELLFISLISDSLESSWIEDSEQYCTVCDVIAIYNHPNMVLMRPCLLQNALIINLLFGAPI